MKTAQEWDIKHQEAMQTCIENTHYLPDEESIRIIREIQLDALKEGMLRAAKLAGARPNTLTMWEVENFIVSAAKLLTEKDVIANNNQIALTPAIGGYASHT